MYITPDASFPAVAAPPALGGAESITIPAASRPLRYAMKFLTGRCFIVWLSDSSGSTSCCFWSLRAAGAGPGRASSMQCPLGPAVFTFRFTYNINSSTNHSTRRTTTVLSELQAADSYLLQLCLLKTQSLCYRERSVGNCLSLGTTQQLVCQTGVTSNQVHSDREGCRLQL